MSEYHDDDLEEAVRLLRRAAAAIDRQQPIRDRLEAVIAELERVLDEARDELL